MRRVDSLMSQTVAEKIISAHAGRAVTAGEIAVVDVDGVMATDATAPLAIQAFEKMNGRQIDRIVLRMALAEMHYFRDIPIKVSIDEAIELAKRYSEAKAS